MSLRLRIACVAAALLLAAVLVTTALQTATIVRGIASKTRADGEAMAILLAQAAAFAAELPAQVEEEIGLQMVIEARMIAHLVAIAERAGASSDEIRRTLRAIDSASGVEIHATDAEGLGYLHSLEWDKPFRFSPDPLEQPQAHVFHSLLSGSTPTLVQEARKREIDDRIFKYVGVGGVDGPRIVQVGLEAAFLERIEREFGLARLINGLVGGEIRELLVLDERLEAVAFAGAPIEPAPGSAGAVSHRDRQLARDCLESGRPIGRFDGNDYRVAAPVNRPDGRTSGAVLVALSTANARSMLVMQGLAAALSICIVGIPGILAALWAARSVSSPVLQAVEVVERLASGDLGTEVPAARDAETGRLLAAMDLMVKRLGGLVGSVKAAGGRLASIDTEASAALARQERSIEGLGGSAAEISAAVAQIAATGDHLVASSGEMAAAARDAVDVAEAGRIDLATMTESMAMLAASMDDISMKLAAISERAGGITTVVTTIAKVADQTNLLSVNATIEAEKAGAAGRGFRVVAREIRRLADQTAIATGDIERMVRDMQAAVAGGTMEMDRFRHDVAGRVEEVSRLGERLGGIVEPVRAVTTAADAVHEGVRSQAAGVKQIRGAMDALREATDASHSAIDVFSRVLGQMRSAIGDINTESSRFRTGSHKGPAAERRLS
ncbi:MAG: methyl-accepting chemotaxis protein [Planctomycetaceae bacterium]